MKKTAVFLLAAFLLSMFAGCGNEDAPDSEASGFPLPSASDAAGEDGGDEIEALSAELAAVITARMFANGNSCDAYRLDFNSDGVEDWAFEKTGGDIRGCWMFIDGAETCPQPDVFYDISAAGGINVSYSGALGQIVIEKFYGSAGLSMSAYAAYDGEAHDYAAEMEKSWDSPGTYVVDGVEASQEEYDAAVAALELTQLSGARSLSDGSQLGFAMPDGAFSRVGDMLSGLPFIEEAGYADADGDGTDELVLLCFSAEDAPAGLDVGYYEAGNSPSSYDGWGVGSWGNAAAVLYSSGLLQFVSWDEAGRILAGETVSTAGELTGIEQDGDYFLKIYRDGLTRTGGGYTAYAELMQAVTYTDEEMEAMLPELGDYTRTDNNGYEEIRYFDGAFVRRYGESVWTSYGPSDMVELEVAGSGTVFVPDSAELTDDQSAMNFGVVREVNNLEEMFSVDVYGGEFEYNPIEVIATVSGGAITALNMYYSP